MHPIRGLLKKSLVSHWLIKNERLAKFVQHQRIIILQSMIQNYTTFLYVSSARPPFLPHNLLQLR